MTSFCVSSVSSVNSWIMIRFYSCLQTSQRSSETISHRPQNRTDRHQYPNNWLERVRQKTSAWNCQGSEGTVTKQRQNTQCQVPTNLRRTTRRFWFGKLHSEFEFKKNLTQTFTPKFRHKHWFPCEITSDWLKQNSHVARTNQKHFLYLGSDTSSVWSSYSRRHFAGYQW